MDKTLRRPIKRKDTSNYEKPYYNFFRRLRIQQKYHLIEIGYFLLLPFLLSLLLLLLLFILLLLSLLLYPC